jgi:hypothetical protein
MTGLPIVCTLTPSELRARGETLIPALAKRAEQIEPITDGYRLRFQAAGNVVSVIAQTIEAERQCCRFLRFDLSVEAGGGPIALTITGPSGTSDFLANLMSIDPANDQPTSDPEGA